MDKIKEVLRKYNIKPFGFQKNNSVTIVTTKDNKYVLKEKTNKTKELFNYLKSRSFYNYPELVFNDNEFYDVYRYYDDYDISSEEKGSDLINILSLLHTKTTHSRNVDIDNYKIIYEDIDKKINNLNHYYQDMNDVIDSNIYMAPSHYLLARHISKINSLFEFLKKELDDWYELIKDTKKERVALIHNNVELNHLLRNTDSYLISWDKAKVASPIYDIYNFYKKNYKDLEFSDLFNTYFNRYPLEDQELKLLFILISLPERIEFNSNELDNTLRVNELLHYIYKTDNLISPYYPKYEEEEND